VFGVQIQRATYTLALRSSAQVAEAARRYAAQLHDYFWMQEEDDKYEGARHPDLPTLPARY
jgi:hypothetical protein